MTQKALTASLPSVIHKFFCIDTRIRPQLMVSLSLKSQNAQPALYLLSYLTYET